MFFHQHHGEAESRHFFCMHFQSLRELPPSFLFPLFLGSLGFRTED